MRVGINQRVSLRKFTDDIRRWVEEGRSDDWIASALGTSPSSVQSFRSRNAIYRSGVDSVLREPKEFSSYEGVLESEGDGIWFDPEIGSDPRWQERWKGAERVELRLTPTRIVLLRRGGAEGPARREGFGIEKRILLVEDDASFREVFTHALREALAPERLDVTFVEAGTLAEARTRLREGGLDAAMIDITLPDGNGLDLVEQINDGGPGDPIPTLVLTASLETSVAGRAMEAGAQGAFSKMASVANTVDAIKRLTDASLLTSGSRFRL